MEFAGRAGTIPTGHGLVLRPAARILPLRCANTLKCNEKILIWVIVAALSGCTAWRPESAAPAKEEPPPKPPEPAEDHVAAPDPAPPPGPTPEERLEISRLLNDAARALATDHLTYPASGSALDLYDRVLILEPGNSEALRGLERIVERYLNLALTAAEQRRFESARAMLDRSRLVDPDHPGIAPAEAQIRLLSEANRRVIALDGALLRDRDPSVLGTLRAAGAASRVDGCRAEITARSDAEGRWMYQQMSEVQGQARIRAQLSIGSPPRIEVLCFEP